MKTLPAAAAALLATALAAAPLAAADFPNRPVRIIVPFSAGSATDILARAISVRLTDMWGQQVLVDNRPGAGGTLGANLVVRANPDGYTLLSVSTAHAVAAAIYPKLPYDTTRDLAGITLSAVSKYVLVVSPALGIRSLKDLLALARAKPGTLNFSSAGVGSGTHFAAEILKSMAKIDVVHVPFKGIPEALTDVIGGRVDFLMVPIVAGLAQIKAGKVQALAVGTNKRSAVLPDLPALVETYPGSGFDGWFGLLTSSKTPRDVVARLLRLKRGDQVREEQPDQRGKGADHLGLHHEIDCVRPPPNVPEGEI